MARLIVLAGTDQSGRGEKNAGLLLMQIAQLAAVARMNSAKKQNSSGTKTHLAHKVFAVGQIE